MHDSGYRLRQYYVDQRRRFQPHYKPDTKTEALWDDVADFAIQHSCHDLQRFVEAAFSHSGNKFPWPNQLKTMRVVAWYKEHEQAVVADTNAIKPEVYQQHAGNLRQLEYHQDWHHYERYVQQQVARGWSIQKVLLCDFIPLAAWFRFLYCIPADPEVRAAYYEAARIEVVTNPHLQDFLKERNIDVGSLFF